MTTKTKWLIAIFLAGYALIALVIRGSSLPDSTKLLLISGHTVIYLSVVFAEISQFSQHFGAAGEWIRSLSNVGRAGKKHELYRAMGNALGYLAGHAYVTYFNDKGPEESKNPAETQYHEQFHATVSLEGGRTFRRVIALLPSDSAAKRDWVKKEIEFSGKHENYTLRFITPRDESELPLNVQIFDNFVFLIDPIRDNEDTLPRDIHFLSEEIAEIWFRYHRLIWDRSEKKPPDSYFQG